VLQTLAGHDAKRHEPYLMVPGLTHPPPRDTYSSRSEHGRAQKAKVCVLVQLGCEAYAVWCSCSSAAADACGKNDPDKYKKHGKAPAGLTAKEMRDSVKEFLEHVASERRKPGGASRPLPRVLIVDRDPSHSQLLQTLCEENNIILLRLPPRSYDLSPLDTNYFGQLKNKQHEWVSSHRGATAAEAFLHFKELLHKLSADADIQGYELRLTACKNKGGDHFEDEYERLKRQ
jgi:hypothetical protein